jgi:hypothetical protein
VAETWAREHSAGVQRLRSLPSPSTERRIRGSYGPSITHPSTPIEQSVHTNPCHPPYSTASPHWTFH